MFVSRGLGDAANDSGYVQVVLIETAKSTDLDKRVIPAVVELVLQDITSVWSRFGHIDISTAILAIDRPPQDFAPLCKRCSIPFSSVVDGFYQWYGTHEEGKVATAASSKHNPKNGRAVHIGDHNPASDENGSVSKGILTALNGSIGRILKNRIVVIDSLTSILRIWPDISSILDLIDKVCEVGVKSSDGSNNLTTLIISYRDVSTPKSFLSPLKKLADTHVRVSQSVQRENTAENGVQSKSVRDLVHLDVRRRKRSGRVQLENFVGNLDWNSSQIRDVVSKADDAKDAERKIKDEEEELQARKLAELGLSFRVSLSTKEREVRAAAGLPYLHRDEDLADSALELHPSHLQVDARGTSAPGSESEEGEFDSDDEELFSEDV